MADRVKLSKRKMLMLLEFILQEDEDEHDDSEIIMAGTASLSPMSLQRFRHLARHRQNGYVALVAETFRIDEFKTFFRVSRISVQSLQDQICEICNEKNIIGITERVSSGGSIQKCIGDRLLMLFWYMASLDKYAAIADRFDMSESTACCAIRNLLRFMCDNILERLVTWPTFEECQEMQELYETSHGFPGVVGMIDGTHIAIRRPTERCIDYYNRKDYYSVVLQVVVREDMRFTNVYAGWPGKVHDARVFRHSDLRESGPTLCDNGHILGDSAYPNLSFLLTPFKDNGHLTNIQRRYNLTHAKIRSLVERAIGLLKNRLTRLKMLDQRNIETIVMTILAGCVIHNVCILNNDDFLDALNNNDDIPQPQPNRLNFNANEQVLGVQKRLDIARRL